VAKTVGGNELFFDHRKAIEVTPRIFTDDVSVKWFDGAGRAFWFAGGSLHSEPLEDTSLDAFVSFDNAKEWPEATACVPRSKLRTYLSTRHGHLLYVCDKAIYLAAGESSMTPIVELLYGVKS
jgi:hypothetical protein